MEQLNDTSNLCNQSLLAKRNNTKEQYNNIEITDPIQIDSDISKEDFLWLDERENNKKKKTKKR